MIEEERWNESVTGLLGVLEEQASLGGVEWSGKNLVGVIDERRMREPTMQRLRSLPSHRHRDERSGRVYLLYHSTSMRALADVGAETTAQAGWLAAPTKSVVRTLNAAATGVRCHVYQTAADSTLLFTSHTTASKARPCRTAKSLLDLMPSDLVASGLLEPGSFAVFMEETGHLLKSGWIQALSACTAGETVFPTVQAWCHSVVKQKCPPAAVRAFDLVVTPTGGWWHWIDFHSQDGSSRTTGSELVRRYFDGDDQPSPKRQRSK